MPKTYEKPTLDKRQKLSVVTAQQAASGPTGPAG
ncbi:putative RiPP precursor [Mesorhizobium sp. M00.F.Ca.ET.186.01.1.1]|nr:putative RiPP precursor [bacterium M00.F.Ca.ET.205.01.1.1]TGU50491.1 putative RiPP precursor [bacterium M00.F.Ca.ET.152.01.1.1]TGV33957.1 putative RiPP precursor [Mesorhizobium sp. M00.F.Ca.ET.186.01.1.1]TGZ40855.1 putative RiPP precursor [bacterium M00.F.Ca.ET.162.01.1.1]